jgi:hypothetical protein
LPFFRGRAASSTNDLAIENAPTAFSCMNACQPELQYGRRFNVRDRAFVAFLCSILIAFVIATLGCAGSLFDKTARCVDGTYTDSTNCTSACFDHGGVDAWFTSDCGGVGKAVTRKTATEKVR